MGMFESYFKFKNDGKMATFVKTLAENTMPEAHLRKRTKISLKTRIEKALNDDTVEAISIASTHSAYNNFIEECHIIRAHPIFIGTITLTILLVGIFSGFETNLSLTCSRLKLKHDRGRDTDNINDKIDDCDHSLLYIDAVAYFAQAIFTGEFIIKMGSEGSNPWN